MDIDRQGQATAFAELLADRVAASGRSRPTPDPTAGGPLRILDGLFGPDRVDAVMTAALAAGEHFQPTRVPPAEAWGRRPATRAAAGDLPDTEALLTVWRGPSRAADPAEVRTALRAARQLPGPFAAAADALLDTGPADLTAIPVTLHRTRMRLVCGPLERLADIHLHQAFTTIWEHLKATGGGRATNATAVAAARRIAGDIRPALLDAKHTAERDGTDANVAALDGLLAALDAVRQPQTPHVTGFCDTALSGNLGHWAALDLIAGAARPDWAGWLIDVVPLPPRLHRPATTLADTASPTMRPLADWWRAHEDATRLPPLLPDPEGHGVDPHRPRTATAHRHAHDPTLGRVGPVGIPATIDDLDAALTTPDRRTVLLGPPGIGKSDSLRITAHRAATAARTRPDHTPAPIILTAPAAAIARHLPADDLLTATLLATDPTMDRTLLDTIRTTAAKAGTVVLVDAYDELADPIARGALLDRIDAADHPVVIASRPEHHDALAADLAPLTIIRPDPLATDQVNGLVADWLHDPDQIAVAQRLLASRPALAGLCTRPLYARLLAAAITDHTPTGDLATPADLLHAVLHGRIRDLAKHHRPLPLTAEETEERLAAAAAIGLAHLQARALRLGTTSAPPVRVTRQDLQALLGTAPVRQAVLEDVRDALGILDTDPDATKVWAHQLIGEYLAGRALADLACSADPTARQRGEAIVLARRAFQPDWLQPLALCAGELDRRARLGDPRAADALATHRTLLTRFAPQPPIPGVDRWDDERRYIDPDQVVPMEDSRVWALHQTSAWEIAVEEHLAVVVREDLEDFPPVWGEAPIDLDEEVAAHNTPAPTNQAPYIPAPLTLHTTYEGDGKMFGWVADTTAHAHVGMRGHDDRPLRVDVDDPAAAWADLVAASGDSGIPRRVVETFAKVLPAAADLLLAADVIGCALGDSDGCGCWPHMTVDAVWRRATPPMHTAAGPINPEITPTWEVCDKVVAMLVQRLEEAGPNPRVLHGLLSLMAHGSTTAAAALLGCDPDDAARSALALLDDPPAALRIPTDALGEQFWTLGVHPGWSDIHDPPPRLDDLGLDVPMVSSAALLRAATVRFAGQIPEHWTATDTADLFHLTAADWASGLPPAHLDHWAVRALSGPHPVKADGTPDFTADRHHLAPFIDTICDLVSEADILAADPTAAHRLLCPAVNAATRFHRQPHSPMTPLAQPVDGDALCEAVGHADDARWLGHRDLAAPDQMHRGLEAAGRLATTDPLAALEHIEIILGTTLEHLPTILDLAADPALTATLATTLTAAGHPVPDPTIDPVGVWAAAIEAIPPDMVATETASIYGELLLRSRRWPDPLGLTDAQIMTILTGPSPPPLP